MNKFASLTIALTIFGAGASFAAEQDEILQIQQFAVAEGVNVDLMTIRRTNGQVCQDYVNKASRDNAGHISSTKATVCGSAVVVLDINGQTITHPANLLALKTVEDDGLNIQMAIIDPNA